MMADRATRAPTSADSFIEDPRTISEVFPWVPAGLREIVEALAASDPTKAEMLALKLLDRLDGKKS